MSRAVPLNFLAGIEREFILVENVTLNFSQSLHPWTFYYSSVVPYVGLHSVPRSSPYSFFFCFIYLFTLQYCIGFAIHWHESAIGVHVFPILKPPHLPPHPIPLGHPSAPAPSIPYHALNLDWWFISHMTIFFPALLPISPFVPMSACTTLAPRPCFPWAALRQWLSAGRKPTKALCFEMRTSFNGWLWLKDSPLAWPELSYNCACTPGSSFCLCFTGLGLHQPKEKIGPSILR